MQTTTKRSRSAGPCAGLAVLALLATSPAAAEQRAARSGADASACQLNIEGEAIEKLMLRSQAGRLIPVNRPGPSVSLPAGRYFVQEVHLRGGFRSYLRRATSQDWFTLAPSEPCQLKVGAPLTPHVDVKRRGKFLTMHYQLRDAGNRSYLGRSRAKPPQFAVYQDERPIASGSFEYG